LHTRGPRISGYLLPVGAGALATTLGSGLAWALVPFTGTASLAPVIAAVAVVSVLSGTLSGVVASILGAAMAMWILFPPAFDWFISPEELARTVLVFALCVGLALGGGRVRRVGRRIEDERARHQRTADALQQALVPTIPAAVGGVSLARVFIPQGTGDRIGGDFLDVFPLAGGDVVLVVGDVCGKGPRAGQLASVARGAIRLAAASGLTADEILRRANNEVMAFTTESARFVAVTLVRIVNPVGDTQVEVACAGQPMPALVRPNGAVDLVGTPGVPLGIDHEPFIIAERTRMAPGDVLVAYSDGVTDVRPRRDAAIWGEEGLSLALAHAAGGDPSAVAHAMEEAIRARGGRRLPDDVAAIVAGRAASPRATNQMTLDLSRAAETGAPPAAPPRRPSRARARTR
jgi:hypothetical protein